MSIKETREQKNMTQDDVASAVGVGRTTVAMWETGKSSPRADTLIKLAELFGCSVDIILREETANKKAPVGTLKN